MASKLDEWGYTEMKSQYDRFMQGEQIPSQDKTESKDDPLSVVTSTAVKRAIVDTNITLKREGNDKRHTFLNRVRRMFGEKQHDKFNATGFQARLREDREKLVDKNKTAETNQSVPPKRLQRLDDSFQSEETTQSAFRFQQKLSQVRAKSGKAQENGRKTMEEVDKTGIEDEMRVLKETKKAHVVNEEGFRQIKTSKGADHIERKAQLEINREKAMKRFFIEDNKQEFQNKEHGGHDDLSLAVRMEGGRTVELDLTEIRALGKYLEEEEKKDMEDKRLDKAA